MSTNEQTSQSAFRFSLWRLMASITVLCAWLSLYSVDAGLFLGAGLLVMSTGWLCRRYPQLFRMGVYSLNETMALGFFLVIGFCLVARYFAE